MKYIIAIVSVIGIAVIIYGGKLIYDQDVRCEEAGGYMVKGSCIKKEVFIKV